MDLIDCPACGLPAEVLHHFTLPSTSGPVPHVRLRCISGHVLTPPAERLRPPPNLRAVAADAHVDRRPGERAT